MGNGEGAVRKVHEYAIRAMSTYRAAADCYDLLYQEKRYDEEAALVAAAIRTRAPHATTLLDVACGTGRHARHFAVDHGFTVDGIDLEPRFVARARTRLAGAQFSCGDMRDFDLGTTYDAVVCLFGSIGYAESLDGLHRSVAAMTRHVAARGVLTVEPWFEPGAIQDGFLVCHTGAGDGMLACRMSRTTIDDGVSTLRFEYLIGTPAGIRHESEVHRLGLFTRKQMTEAISRTGLICEYDPTGPTGRGLYIAHRPP